ncbi:hypothetical protein [Ralstonia pseudosolanacearum]|uniref:hypothetical protein n=1 Tax=Ralstonia pseudosolanacearum TaxID=1310165 RepID=UPI003CF0F1C4
MTQRKLGGSAEAIRFGPDLICCKPGRASVGLGCDRPTQQCCAWHHIRLVVRHRGDSTLIQFAEHLLARCQWSLGEVFFSFNAAGESSSLAVVCAKRWRAIPTAADRAAYRNQICVDTSPEFLAVFDVLCEAENGPQ